MSSRIRRPAAAAVRRPAGRDRGLLHRAGVRHADGRQLQRPGLQPDVLVRPTIGVIRAGRDEVLERALRYLGTGR